MITKRFIEHIGLCILLLSFGTVAHAVTATPTSTLSATPTAVVSDKTKQLEDLKDRLATKVAELQQSQRMAIYGTVSSVTATTFTVDAKTKNYKIELADDLKIYQILKGKRTALTADDLSKNDIVTVFGLYDSTLDLLKAKIVFIQNTDPIQISGTITAVSKSDYTITINTKEQKTYIIDFETTTKTAVFNGTTSEKGGFSRFGVGDVIHVTGSAVPKKDARVSASRILDIGVNGKGISSPTPTEKAATPTATIKPTGKTTPAP